MAYERKKEEQRAKNEASAERVFSTGATGEYPLVNIQKAMENHHF